MALRTPLSVIDANRASGSALSDRTKGRILARYDDGWKVAKIAMAEGLNESSIRSLIQRRIQRGNVTNLRTAGRRSLLTDRAVRALARIVRKSPQITVNRALVESRLGISGSTFKRAIKLQQIEHWRAKQRPELTEELAAKRLTFALKYRNEDFSKWLFSDECSVELGKQPVRAWSWGYPGEQYTPSRVETYRKGKQGTQIVWAIIGLSLQSTTLIVMDRENQDCELGQEGSFTASSYIDTLEQGLKPDYDGQTFQQDNAPIYKAAKTRAWFDEEGIFWIKDWPPYSPDLNPIEHLWPRLKELLYKLHPDLLLDPKSQASINKLREVLPIVWQAIPRETVEAYLNSMKSRLEAVIAAKGWYTKY
jgi:hypothetical protein